MHLVSQDFTVPGGAAGEVHCAKMADMMQLSLKTGRPFPFMNDAGGARVEHGMSNPASVAIYSSVLPTALKPGASSEGDETKLCRRALAGVVVRLHVKPGGGVPVDDLLLVLDAMRMETKINARLAGNVKSIEVAPKHAVKPDQVLVHLE